MSICKTRLYKHAYTKPKSKKTFFLLREKNMQRARRGREPQKTITIGLPIWLLNEIDEEAKNLNISRSLTVVEALKKRYELAPTKRLKLLKGVRYE